MAKLICYPVGNGDSLLITSTNDRLVLIDFCNRPAEADRSDKRIDLAEALDAELEAHQTDTFDTVAITHLDKDHIQGSSVYFHFEHSATLQGGGRKKIKTLWVPAAVITENLDKDTCTDDHLAIQKEARHRFKKGKGILVFSYPRDLKQWMKDNGMSPTDQSCIARAGTLATGFNKDADHLDFFIHAPESTEDDISDDLARNETSILMQATFVEGGMQTRVLLLSDAPHELLADIVVRSERKKNEHRLEWDILRTPHHGSYLSIGSEKGKDETVPTDEVKRLYETHGQTRGVVISSCDVIPTDDKDDQPPHRQAAAYYRRVARKHSGEEHVTMEFPSRNKPGPMEITIDDSGFTITKAVAAASGGVLGDIAPRAG